MAFYRKPMSGPCIGCDGTHTCTNAAIKGDTITWLLSVARWYPREEKTANSAESSRPSVITPPLSTQFSLSFCCTCLHRQTHPASHHQSASQPFALHSHPQILPSSALPAQRQTGAARQPVRGVEGRSSGVTETDIDGKEGRTRGGVEWVKGDQGRGSTVAHMPRGAWAVEQAAPTEASWLTGASEPGPKRAWKTLPDHAWWEKEGREKLWRGAEARKATTVGCPTQLLYRDDVGSHVTQGLQWRRMEGRKETSFKAGAFWVVWGLCSPPQQPQNHRRAARGWCLRATWSVNG